MRQGRDLPSSRFNHNTMEYFSAMTPAADLHSAKGKTQGHGMPPLCSKNSCRWKRWDEKIFKKKYKKKSDLDQHRIVPGHLLLYKY
jgi:hypothetical protein